MQWGKIKIRNAKQSEVKYELENFTEHVVHIQKKIYISLA